MPSPTAPSLSRALFLLFCFLTACSKNAAPEADDEGARAHDAGTRPDDVDGGDAGSRAPVRTWACVADSSDVEYLHELGCWDDFVALASRPLDETIPGARSVKTSIDRAVDATLSFQNSVTYPIHWDFLTALRSVNQDLPPVPSLTEFNATEYFSPSRRFVLGAVTFYEGPAVWAYEMAPYDSADLEMISEAFRSIAEHTYIGNELHFHPTSVALEELARELPSDIPIVTTQELFEGIDYQPLNPAVSIGQLRFVEAATLDTDFVGFRDIVVLDHVPNDISVTQGIITAEFQTPLSHINVLSQNRGTPNMALRNAMENEALRALEGQWVRLEVDLQTFTIEQVTEAEADAWWDEHKPQEVQVPGLDLTQTGLTDCEDMIDPAAADLLAEFKGATRAFGGKAANFAGLTHIEGLRVPDAFGIPVHFYMQFMQENGFDQRVTELLADPEFQNDAAVRDAALSELRDTMKLAPVNADFVSLLEAKLTDEYPGTRMRFRSSTNAEDLDGFTGAGLYTSKSAELETDDPPLDAIRSVWASVWYFRAFEERSYRSIDHLAVGMALLVHPSFPDEEANGVALTGNPFDKTGVSPAFYINVQFGEASVVQPEAGITTEEFLYFYDTPNQPVSYLSQSNLVTPGERVLSVDQVQELGAALDAIRTFYAPAYRQDPWWAMDVEFKFDGEPGEEPQLFVKQARPFGNR